MVQEEMKKEDRTASTAKMAKNTTEAVCKNKQQQEIMHGFGADEETTTAPAPEPPRSSREHSLCYRSERKVEEESPLVEAMAALQHPILHGHPVTISQCKFQAHIARINTRTEAQAVSDAVSAQTAREAGLSGFVCPFAFRLGCVDNETPENSNGDHSMDEEGDPARKARGSINGEEEGYCDNGDVGAGEKLLCLLQKWDVRHRVLIVARIDGGFMRAELLGVRRYKFIVDRAKRLLDNSDLASLRRAVDTDINPTTVAAVETNRALHEETMSEGARNNRHKRLGARGGGGAWVDGIMGEDGWDRFVVPLSAVGTVPGQTGDGDFIVAPSANGGGRIVLPHTTSKESPPCRVSPNKAGTGVLGLGSSRAREQRALSLAQLSICSQTVEFAPGHVPCSMGDKGYGKKRGRVNHFAVRTPPSTYRDGDSVTSDPDKGDSVGAEDVRSSRIAASPRWPLPHELDPTSATTSLGEGGSAGGDGSSARRSRGNRGWGASNSALEPFHDASTDVLGSRASSCATINSPGRISTIMMGVFSGLSHDYPLHPPPPSVAGCGGKLYYHAEVNNRSGSSSSTVAPCAFVGNSAGSSAPSCNTSEASSARGVGGRHCYTKATLSGVISGTVRNDRDGVPPHRPGGVNAGLSATTGHGKTAPGFTKDRRAAAIRNDNNTSDSIDHRSAVGRTSSVNGRGGGDGSTNGGIPLPLLRGTPGVGVREEESRLVQDGDGDGRAAIPCAALGSTSPSVGGWQDDGDRSISTSGDNNYTLSMERPSPPSPHAPGDDPGLASPAENERCDSSGIWSLGYPTPRPRVISEEMPPSRAKSALRGWSVGSAVPACQPDCDGLNN